MEIKYVDSVEDGWFYAHITKEVDESLIDKVKGITGVESAYKGERYQVRVKVGLAFNKGCIKIAVEKVIRAHYGHGFMCQFFCCPKCCD